MTARKRKQVRTSIIPLPPEPEPPQPAAALPVPAEPTITLAVGQRWLVTDSWMMVNPRYVECELVKIRVTPLGNRLISIRVPAQTGTPFGSSYRIIPEHEFRRRIAA